MLSDTAGTRRSHGADISQDLRTPGSLQTVAARRTSLAGLRACQRSGAAAVRLPGADDATVAGTSWPRHDNGLGCLNNGIICRAGLPQRHPMLLAARAAGAAVADAMLPYV